MLRILIADDHEIVRTGLKQILREEYPFAQIEDAEDGNMLIEKALNGQWDIVISDLAMPGMNGIDALKKIKEVCPDCPVLILSMYPEEQYAIRVIKSGAAGYLSKDKAQEELIVAVRKILSGKKYLNPSLADQLISTTNGPATPHDILSDRELIVMKMIGAGISTSDISQELNLSPTTISTYRSRILEKMNMKSNAEITRYVIENKLL
jgi:two-component system, NarL family, invasion response regulator UvrY